MSGLQREDAYDYQNEDLLEGQREASKPEEKNCQCCDWYLLYLAKYKMRMLTN